MVTVESNPTGISIPGLAQKWLISEAVLYRLANAGKLPGCRRLGHRFVVHHEEFESWMKAGNGDELGDGDAQSR